MSAETPIEAMAAEAVQVPEKQEEIVDPEEWYEELLQEGHHELFIKKTSIVKKEIVLDIEHGQEAVVGQDKAITRKIARQIMLQNRHSDGSEHEGEERYPFGDGNHTLEKRAEEFEEKYEEILNMPGFYRKKGNQLVKGIRVPVSKRIKSIWYPNGIEVSEGGYLVKASENNYYPINPDSLWGYEILEKEDDDD